MMYGLIGTSGNSTAVLLMLLAEDWIADVEGCREEKASWLGDDFISRGPRCQEKIHVAWSPPFEPENPRIIWQALQNSSLSDP